MKAHRQTMLQRRARHPSEELANALTHGIGLILSIAGFIVLMIFAARRGSIVDIVACLIYGLSLLALYGASTYYHCLKSPWKKKRARLLDHCAIYLLIAGTYTPFALVVLESGLGWIVFGLIWMLAFSGICFKTLTGKRAGILSTTSYILMGWLSLFLLVPLYRLLPLSGFVFLLAGGIAYTLGIYFYARGHQKFHHAIWHVFVMAGSFCHYLAIFSAVSSL